MQVRTAGGRRRAATAAVICAALLGSSVRCAAAAPDRDAEINLVRDIGPRIAACWHPPHADDQITIRLSFTRSGVLIGRPQIAFVRSSRGADGEPALVNSILVALHGCTPLRFSAALGAAIAGRVLAIRFVGHRNPPGRVEI